MPAAGWISPRQSGRHAVLAFTATLSLLSTPIAAFADSAGAWRTNRDPGLAAVTNLFDRDGDSVPDLYDNCPDVSNSDQADRNDDGLGDACDPNTPAPPQAEPDAFMGVQDRPLRIPAPGVLANDSPGTASLQEATESTEKGGVVTISTSGAFTYRPPKGFRGVDAFAYRLSGPGGDVLAVVQIAVLKQTHKNATPAAVSASGSGHPTRSTGA